MTTAMMMDRTAMTGMGAGMPMGTPAMPTTPNMVMVPRCTMNGMMVCCCNMTMGACKVEMTASGCCVTCTSGDKTCEAMIQGCCDCVAACMKAGCTCCLMMGGTPVCCCVC